MSHIGHDGTSCKTAIARTRKVRLARRWSLPSTIIGALSRACCSRKGVPGSSLGPRCIIKGHQPSLTLYTHEIEVRRALAARARRTFAVHRAQVSNRAHGIKTSAIGSGSAVRTGAGTCLAIYGALRCMAWEEVTWTSTSRRWVNTCERSARSTHTSCKP